MHYFNILGNCPKKITVTSTGAASTWWKTTLGSYNLIRYDDTANAIYEHALKNGNFLYKSKGTADTWMVSKWIYGYD